MSKCVLLLPEQSREPRGRSTERPAGGGGAVLLPAPAESSGGCHGKGSTRHGLQSLGEGKGCLGLTSLRTLALTVVPPRWPGPLQLGWEVGGWPRVSRLL